jgi:OOP family OmpA-OmpF porin
VDSYGAPDLYVSFKKNDSVWTEPLDMGGIVNSAGDESGPFLDSDNVTLYFSSNGFSGYGGNDIYMSKRLDDTWTNWSEPKNMGPEINSKGEELFFNIPATSDYAYYSRGTSADNLDIFRAKLPFFKSPVVYVTVKGKLIDQKTGQAIAAKIVYERLSDGKEIGTALSDAQTGEYEIKLPAGEIYGVHAEAAGHMSQNQHLDLRQYKADGTVANQNMNLAPIEVVRVEEKAVVTLNNVFFDFDKAILKPESNPELNRVVELLNKYPTMKVEIAGHADAIGAADYNMRLSKMRSDKVAGYLFENGIAKDRVKVTHFGESKPIVPNNTAENRKKNRRVEFIILTM